MAEIVQHSAETFIQEDFETVIFQDEVDSYQQIFHNNFQHVYDEWQKEEPNNVLFLDCDTLVINPVEGLVSLIVFNCLITLIQRLSVVQTLITNMD